MPKYRDLVAGVRRRIFRRTDFNSRDGRACPGHWRFTDAGQFLRLVIAGLDPTIHEAQGNPQQNQGKPQQQTQGSPKPSTDKPAGQPQQK
jgi:hypothetical protein